MHTFLLKLNYLGKLIFPTILFPLCSISLSTQKNFAQWAALRVCRVNNLTLLLCTSRRYFIFSSTLVLVWLVPSWYLVYDHITDSASCFTLFEITNKNRFWWLSPLQRTAVTNRKLFYSRDYMLFECFIRDFSINQTCLLYWYNYSLILAALLLLL